MFYFKKFCKYCNTVKAEKNIIYISVRAGLIGSIEHTLKSTTSVIRSHILNSQSLVLRKRINYFRTLVQLKKCTLKKILHANLLWIHHLSFLFVLAVALNALVRLPILNFNLVIKDCFQSLLRIYVEAYAASSSVTFSCFSKQCSFATRLSSRFAWYFCGICIFFLSRVTLTGCSRLDIFLQSDL